ncbi:hypothetical protein T09_11807 [Trichinella sp. T9]|nr:hypothetical protein T09_11807 [Trichinella sp. T9]
MTCSRALANEWPLSAVTAPGLPAQFAAAPSTNILPLLCAGALYKMALKRRSVTWFQMEYLIQKTSYTTVIYNLTILDDKI